MAMTPLTMSLIIVSFVQLVLLLSMDVFFFKKMKETNLKSLKWLFWEFLMASLVGVGSMARMQIISHILIISVRTFLILYTRDTFYQEKQSGFKIIFYSNISLSVGFYITYIIDEFIFPSLALHFVSVSFLAGASIVSVGWLIKATWNSYNSVKDNNLVENHIKKRYKVLTISAIIYSLQAIVTLLLPIPIEGWSFIMVFIIAAIELVFVFGNFYAWIILGKKTDKQKDDSARLSEEEVMALLAE